MYWQNQFSIGFGDTIAGNIIDSGSEILDIRDITICGEGPKSSFTFR